MGTFGEIFSDRGHGGARVGGGVIDFKAIASGEDGGFHDIAVFANFVGCGIPVGFGDGELFADFDFGVVNGKTNDVDLKSFGSGFQTLLKENRRRREGSRNKNRLES